MMNFQDFREHLPLRFDRPFHPWSYQLSHGRLVFRSRRADDTLFVTFINVIGMQVRHWYKELVIAEAAEVAEIDWFVDVPARHSHRYMRLSVGDGTRDGFVVCGALDVRVEPSGHAVEIDPAGSE
jgi:hypothetical protein